MSRCCLMLGGIALCLAGSRLHAQAFPGVLRAERPQWATWEMPVPGAKRDHLARLGICLDDRTWLNGFHFVDVDGNGRPDVIYSGPMAYCSEYGEGDLTIVFLERGGRAHRVFSDPGVVAAIARQAPGQPIALTIRRDGCCDDPYFSIGLFRPQARGETLAFVQSERFTSIARVQTPTRLYREPVPVRVTQQRYVLRLTPEIDDTTTNRIWPYDEPRGNAIGEYGQGATGRAYAEARDRTGRLWLFVLMDPVPPPTHLSGDVPSDSTAHYFGWMSSRFLAVGPAALGP